MKRIKATALFVLLVMLTAVMAPAASASSAKSKDRGKAKTPRVAGMVYTQSDRSFDETWATLTATIEGNPAISEILRVDHAAAAASVDLDLDPNRVLFFGNPNLGTPLMKINQVAGLDLPQRMHVFEEDGNVWVGFNDASFLKARHRLGKQPQLDTIAGALRGIAGAATDNEVTDRSASARHFRWKPRTTTIQSDADFDTTWTRLIDTINASPATLAAQVDHQQNASNVGLELRPTRLAIFGNPNLGTPLMESEPTAGFDLPLKILVWEDESGDTFVTTNDENFLRRHKLRRSELTAANNAVGNFVSAAIKTPKS